MGKDTIEITLEQARVLDAVARHGTIQRAAQEIGRAHSAVLYSLKCLEQQTRLAIFDRGGYRNRLSPAGEVVLRYCRRLLETRRELSDACARIQSGWEPSLRLVYDEVVDFSPIGRALFSLQSNRAPTEIKVLAAHLDEVETVFARERADLMVTILPLRQLRLPERKLKPVTLRLVAHRSHPLVRGTSRRLSVDDLNRHTFVTIASAPAALGLGTDQIRFDSYVYVNSFVTKKAALLKGVGFGWLPDYLIQGELKKGSLSVLRSELGHAHTLFPRIYYRGGEGLGRAGKALVDSLLKEGEGRG